MSTMAWQGGINKSGLGNTKVEMNAGDWLGVSNVAFGTGAALEYVSIPATGSNSTMGNTATLSAGWYYIKNVNGQRYLQV